MTRCCRPNSTAWCQLTERGQLAPTFQRCLPLLRRSSFLDVSAAPVAFTFPREDAALCVACIVGPLTALLLNGAHLAQCVRRFGRLAVLREHRARHAPARGLFGPPPRTAAEHFTEELRVPECPVEVLGVFGFELFGVDLSEYLPQVESSHPTRIPPVGIRRRHSRHRVAPWAYSHGHNRSGAGAGGTARPLATTT